MVSYVLEALRASRGVGQVVYVGATLPSLAHLYDALVPAGVRLVDSLALGLGAASVFGAHKMLLCTSDVPWITGAMVDRLLSLAPENAGLVYPVVTKEAAERDFPEQRRTFVKLRDGRFTGGNLVLLEAAAVPALLPLIDAAYRARKNPLALASMIGLKTLAALVTGTASIAGLEARVSGLLGVPARALVTDDAALAADVDDLSHVPGALSSRLPTDPPVGRGREPVLPVETE